MLALGSKVASNSPATTYVIFICGILGCGPRSCCERVRVRRCNGATVRETRGSFRIFPNGRRWNFLARCKLSNCIRPASPNGMVRCNSPATACCRKFARARRGADGCFIGDLKCAGRASNAALPRAQGRAAVSGRFKCQISG